MKGVIFLAFEAFATERFGEAALFDLLDAAGDRLEAQDPYVGPLTYADSDLTILLATCASRHDIELATLQRDLGMFSFGFMAARYTWAMMGHRNYTAFLRTLERTIHPRTNMPSQVQQLIPGSQTPLLAFEWLPGGPIVRYRSERQLCAMAEGLLLGGASYFGEHLQLHKQSCMRDGHEFCTWHAELS